MSAVDVERLMTLLYTSTGVRKRFIDDPLSVMAAFDLDDAEQEGFLQMDRPPEFDRYSRKPLICR